MFDGKSLMRARFVEISMNAKRSLCFSLVYRPLVSAFVLGLLWLKVLGFTKVINEQLATFILAVNRVGAKALNFGCP
jgi:hypothetical protein